MKKLKFFEEKYLKMSPSPAEVHRLWKRQAKAKKEDEGFIEKIEHEIEVRILIFRLQI